MNPRLLPTCGRRLYAAVAVMLGVFALVALPTYATHDNSKVKLQLKPESSTNTVGEQHCVTATVRDTGHGREQAAAGVDVVFTVTGANPTATDVVVVTNAQGEAQFCYTGTKAGTDSIRAYADLDRDRTLDTGEPSAFAQKTYRPGPATSVTLEPPAALNPVGQQHCVTATVKDQFGNTISGARVVFSITGANPTSSPVVRTTNTSGQAQFCYTGQNAGLDTIRAFVDRDADNTLDAGEPVTTATKTYAAPGPTTLTLSPPADTNRAGEQHCVTATATNALGPVSGVPIVFTVTGANTAAGTVTTNTSGQATFCYTGKNVGLDVITAYADVDKDAQQDATEPVATATKTYTPGAPATVTLKPPTSENTVGTQHCVTATVTDEFGNPTPGETVVFTVTGPNETGGSVKTDQNGNAVFCYTGQRSGLDTIRAFVDTDDDGSQDVGEPAGGPVTKLYHPGVPRTVTLEPKADDNVVGEEHCVTATAHDEFGNRVGAGHPIVFEVTGANEAGPTTVMTNAQGQARFCYTGTKAGEDLITAFADNDRDGQQDVDELPGTATKTYKPGPPANIKLEPPTATNTAGDEHCVTATVTDRFGNPTPGVAVEFTVSGANPRGPTVVPTDTNGKAKFCYTGTKAGTDTITATVVGTTLEASATKVYKPGPPANVTLEPKTDVNEAGEEHCVTATVTDRFRNPVEAGFTVFFSVAGANSASGSAATGANGQAGFCYTGIKAGEDVITAVVDADRDGNAESGEPTGTATKTYKPGPPANIKLEPPTATNTAGDEHCVTATVTDRFGNPTPGVAVEFTVSGANPRGPTVVPTDTDGKAKFCYTGTKAGTDTITATVVGTTLEATATKVYKPGPPAIVEMNPETAVNTVFDEHCVTATVTDRFGNPVGAGFEVLFSVAGANTASGSETTNDDSEATFCYTGTSVGKDVIKATVDVDADGAAELDEPTGTATKTWIFPAPTPGCEVKITNGGWIATATGSKGTFGGNARVELDGTARGQEEYHDHGLELNFHSTEVVSVVCFGAERADIFGTGTLNDVPVDFRIRVRDLGEPGSMPGPDTYQILAGAYTSGVEDNPLRGGNVQIHRFS